MLKRIKKITKNWYLLGYALIALGIIRFGIWCYDLIKLILNQKEDTFIVANGIQTIGEFNPNYPNMILLFSFILLYSIGFIVLGIFIIKKKN